MMPGIGNEDGVRWLMKANARAAMSYTSKEAQALV